MKLEFDGEHNEQDSIVCDFCKHCLIRHYTCAAFPEGIPEEILKGKNNHSKPLPDQGNNIVFGLKNVVIPF
jgi:hypothetical protein